MVASLAATVVLTGSAWTFAVGGDVMLNGIKPSSKPLAGVASLFREAGLAYANLEIPLTDQGTATPRKSAADVKARRQFVLRAVPAHLEGLRAAGLDVVSLGNNHAMDYGPEGLAQMTGALAEAGIAFCGAGTNWAQAMAPAFVRASDGTETAVYSMLAFRTRGGLRACTPAGTNSPGIGVLAFDATIGDRARATLRRLVDAARSRADLVVFALHWGTERKTVPDPYQVALGRAAVEAGADLVVGAHPHVLQGAEVYRGKPILYSMGNLVSAKPGATAIMELGYEGATWKSLKVRPCAISGGKVSPVPKKSRAAAIEAFRGLCRSVAKAYPDANATIPEIGG
ncbi:MAG: CapA family protein [Fimbriimonadaceae bacterium]|nr:CapA family protein [Fimbriimonadaceae bacterium]